MREKLQTKQMWKWILVVAVLITGVLGMSVHAQAATRKYLPQLKEGKTYSTKLTGSKTYKVMWKAGYDKKNDQPYINLYINGKRFKQTASSDIGEFFVVNLMKVNKNRTLIAVRPFGDGTAEQRIYEYKGGNLKLLFKASMQLKGVRKYPGGIYNVGNNQFSMDWDVTNYYHADGKSYTEYYANVTYNIGTDKITKAGYIFPTEKRTYTAARKITVYKTASSKSVAFRAEKGSKITVLKMAEIKGVTYLKLQNKKGQSGWVKFINNVGYFEY